MLQLSAEQLDHVDALQARRDGQSLQQVLAQAWPEVAQQLQGRWPAFVDLALARARALGLRSMLAAPNICTNAPRSQTLSGAAGWRS